MKISEIRLMANEELVTKLADQRQEYMNLRFQVTTGQQTDTSRIPVIRKTIAQFETIIRERQLNLNQDLEAKAKAAKPKASKKPTKEVKAASKEEDKTEGVAIPSEEEQLKEVEKTTAPKKAKAAVAKPKPAAAKPKAATAKPKAAAKKPKAEVKVAKSKKTKEGDK